MTAEHCEFAEWVETVRDPATKASEGKRILRAGKNAEASYEIAPLPDGRWAVKVRYTYHCGDCASLGCPWCAFESRAACLAHFLDGAWDHFGDQHHLILSEPQRKAQKRMVSVLESSSLFVEPPIAEPDPDQERSRQERMARLEARRVETNRKLKEQFPLFAALIEKEEG